MSNIFEISMDSVKLLALLKNDRLVKAFSLNYDKTELRRHRYRLHEIHTGQAFSRRPKIYDTVQVE